MKTFQQFVEQVNTIKPLKPYQTKPSEKDPSTKELRDVITGLRPGGQASARLKPPTRV